MNKPKMLLFDYGQTLIELDGVFRGIKNDCHKDYCLVFLMTAYSVQP